MRSRVAVGRAVRSEVGGRRRGSGRDQGAARQLQGAGRRLDEDGRRRGPAREARAPVAGGRGGPPRTAEADGFGAAPGIGRGLDLPDGEGRAVQGLALARRARRRVRGGRRAADHDPRTSPYRERPAAPRDGWRHGARDHRARNRADDPPLQPRRRGECAPREPHLQNSIVEVPPIGSSADPGTAPRVCLRGCVHTFTA